MVWIHLAQGRVQWPALMNAKISLRVPSKERNFSSKCVTIRFSAGILLPGVSECKTTLEDVFNQAGIISVFNQIALV
jgi:hypothetical protein